VHTQCALRSFRNAADLSRRSFYWLVDFGFLMESAGAPGTSAASSPTTSGGNGAVLWRPIRSYARNLDALAKPEGTASNWAFCTTASWQPQPFGDLTDCKPYERPSDCSTRRILQHAARSSAAPLFAQAGRYRPVRSESSLQPEELYRCGIAIQRKDRLGGIRSAWPDAETFIREGDPLPFFLYSAPSTHWAAFGFGNER